MTAMHHAVHPRQLASWIRPLTLSIPLVFALVACGGGGGGSGGESSANNTSENIAPNDPLNAYKTQTLNWVTCGDSAQTVLTRLQCTQFKAPLDYAAPEKGEIIIEATRTPAISTQRKGAIFFNPGGPGGDGLKRELIYLDQIFNNNGSSPQVNALQAQLLNGYDLLGFSPRGAGSASQLNCSSDVDQLRSSPASSYRNLPGNFEAMSANQQAFAQACQAQPLTPFISTDATARDMDLLRHLMGDNKISYLGYSYGTWLGAWYGRLFPERVDRMVLDSNADISAEHMDFNEYQSIARDTIITDLFAPYAARQSATYNLGSTVDEVRLNLANLHPALKTAFALRSGFFYRNNTTPASMIGLVAAKGLNQLLLDQPGADFAQLISDIGTYSFVSPASTLTNYEVRQKAYELLRVYEGLRRNTDSLGQPEGKTQLGVSDGVNEAVFYSVLCNDSVPPSRDLSYWKALGDNIAQKAPFFGGDNPANQTCMYWNTPNIQRPPLSALQGLDILMVQSQYDGATPTPGAMKGFAALPKAHMVYVTGEYTHGVFPYNTACVDVSVLQYLLGQSPNWRQMNCAASGAAFPLDRTLVARSAGSTASSSESPEAQQRSKLINEFKKNIGFSTAN